MERKLEMKKKKKCAIVLRINEDVLDAIDEMRDVFRLNRSQWLRKAIARNLQRNRHELRLIDRPEIRSVLAP
jgi:metal-responsive CopG/Arc/MetJ family transcriptional regulator